jgi:hypothetical protein
MPEFPRDLPHLYLRGSGRPEPYTSKIPPPPHKLPQRERVAHADVLTAAVTQALEAAELTRAERDPGLLSGTPGFYLEFEIPAGAETAAELLENRRKHIELVAVRQESDTAPALATVFVPDSAADHFRNKIEEYRAQNTPHRKPKDPRAEPKPSRPKNEDLIARINNIRLAAVRSVYTDDPAFLPAAGESVWWEVWIRQGYVEAFESVAARLELPVEHHRLVFPDRVVRLVYADIHTLGRLYLNSNSIAELRRAKDTPALFVSWSNVEQAVWAADLAERVVAPESREVAVCILDTGTTHVHPLLAPGLDANDVHKYDPTWADGDQRGHGTKMAGTALYGDLMPWLELSGTVPLTHCLESVKVLPDQGENEPKLYGAITAESIARAEVAAPDRRRAVCLAVTSDIGTNRGRPSSWSAAIDQLSFGDETTSRLVLISAGNIREGLCQAQYPLRNEAESIENPAQAWNAITVGAFTEKTNLADPSYAGWQPIAPAGDLCPTSRTSVVWERQWPIKPDILMEGGNWAASGDQCDCPDDLGLLTTYHDPAIRHFDIFRDTSAATAMAGHLAGRILAAMPQRWPETIRALMIHSAEWTPAMRQQFDAAVSEQQRRSLLRKYGYGVPSYERAVLSAANDLTLIAEDEVEPFWKDGGTIKTRHMNLHDFPWPRTQLEELGETEVELRVTLAYFVEPNPGERGWLRRHRYASHALRFAVKRALESVDEFRRRINAAAAAEEEGLAPVPAGADNWYLGRIRNVGSIHSDYWRGTAAELAQRSAIGVYPIGGWWKENQQHKRYDRRVRYALTVSIRATNGAVDIYTPVRAQITLPTEVTT